MKETELDGGRLVRVDQEPVDSISVDAYRLDAADPGGAWSSKVNWGAHGPVSPERAERFALQLLLAAQRAKEVRHPSQEELDREEEEKEAAG